MRVYGAELKYRIDKRYPVNPYRPLLVCADAGMSWQGANVHRNNSSNMPEDLEYWPTISRSSCPLEVTLLFSDWWDV